VVSTPSGLRLRLPRAQLEGVPGKPDLLLGDRLVNAHEGWELFGKLLEDEPILRVPKRAAKARKKK